MSLTSHNLLTNSPSRISFYFTKPHHLKNPNPSLSSPFPHFTNPPHFPLLKTQSPNPYTFRSFNSPLEAFESDGTLEKRDRVNNFNLDAFLSLAEFICLASSVVIAIGFAVNSALSRPLFVWLGNGVSVWHLVLLVVGVVAGAVIRWRQWRRICKDISKPGGSGVNLVGRIEKLEEDLRSSATIIRVLSRQLEKLGIRFRVTRKALKDPIGETAALAQKNSEATRALAAQEDLLEKELSEIQKVLLAMQEQQQKQLDLILAIGKTGKLWEERQEDPSNPLVEGVKHTAPTQVKKPEQVKTPTQVKRPEQVKKPEQVKTPKQVKKPEQVITPEQAKTWTIREEGNSDFYLGI